MAIIYWIIKKTEKERLKVFQVIIAHKKILKATTISPSTLIRSLTLNGATG